MFAMAWHATSDLKIQRLGHDAILNSQMAEQARQ
jgi:hypothetical protein